MRAARTCALWQIVHRDIKPANILIAEEGNEVKLCDFGFARNTHSGPRDAEEMSSYVVTRWYRPPGGCGIKEGGAGGEGGGATCGGKCLGSATQVGNRRSSAPSIDSNACV
jgi:serine/threonine protein kinase